MRKLFITHFMVLFIFFLGMNVFAQDMRNISTIENKFLNSLNTASHPFYNPQEINGAFSTTVYTFRDLTVFSYFSNTEISVYNSSGTLIETRTLNADEYYSFNPGGGVYKVEGNKTYTVLVGDAITNYVNGYFAVDEAGRGVSTKLNTYMMQLFHSYSDFVIFAYQDGTGFTVRNLEDNQIIAAGTLNAGQHYSFRETNNLSKVEEKPLQVSADRPVSALSYTDQDYYVPSSNGTFAGTLFYGYSGYNGSWTNSITVTSYSNNNNVTVYNMADNSVISQYTLQAGQVHTDPITSAVFWRVVSSSPVTAANIPFAGWTGSYQYMTRAIDQTGRGFGTLFYVPTIASSVHVFSFEAANNITITKLGDHEAFPYTTPEVIYSGTLNEGEYHNFSSVTGRFVYKIEGTKNLSVLQSNGGAGADFMPLAYSLDYPDLTLSSSDINYSKPDVDIVTNDNIQITVTVHNFGSVAASNVNVVAFEGDPDLGLAPPIGSGAISNIPVGGSANIVFNYKVPANPEYKTIVVKIDPNNSIVESNKSNNKASRSLKPNNDLLPPISITTTAPSGLTISNGNLSPNPFEVKFDLFNTGTVASDNVTATLELFDGLTLASGTLVQNLGTISGQASAFATYSINANPAFSGFNRYKLTVTSSNTDPKVISKVINIPDATAPSTPQNLSAVMSGSCVRVSWNPNNESDLAGYYLYYSIDGINWNGTGANQGNSPIIVTNANQIDVCGLPVSEGGTTYHFMLKSFDTSNNESPQSNVVSLKVTGGQVTTEELFYGDHAGLYWIDQGVGGYVIGPNKYGDLGKYQRFDISGSKILTKTKFYFGHKKVVGNADDFSIVVKAVAPNGSPASELYLLGSNTNDVDVTSPAVVPNQYDINPGVQVTNSFFIGFEWLGTFDDELGLLSDTVGLGDGAKRAWEKWGDGTYHDIDAAWQGFDVDLWIAAIFSSATDVEGEDGIPSNFSLEQNYPNPFNPSTSIRFSLPERNYVTLSIYNLLGEKVIELINEEMPAGNHEIMFNAGLLSSGIYMYRLEAGNFVQSKKMILMK